MSAIHEHYFAGPIPLGWSFRNCWRMANLGMELGTLSLGLGEYWEVRCSFSMASFRPFSRRTSDGSMRHTAASSLSCLFFGVGSSMETNGVVRFDGGAVTLFGVAIIMYWPR